MFASPGLWVTFTISEAPSALLVVPSVDAERRLERQIRTASDRERTRHGRARALRGGDRAVDRLRVAVGRVEHELRAVDFDVDRFQPERHAIDALRERALVTVSAR